VGLSAALGESMARAAGAVPPITPDGEEARRWAEDELSDPVYDIAEPTPLDRVAHAVGQFFENLFSAELPGGLGSLVALIAAIVVVIVIVAAFAVWGVPRASRRARAQTPALFGEAERRSASQLRAAAASHAQKAEWDAAIVLRFRALARACDERGVVDLPPGATVHAFARAASRGFPELAARLEAAAAAFDDVRYLRRPGTAELYRLVADTDDAVASARPAARQEAPA